MSTLIVIKPLKLGEILLRHWIDLCRLKSKDKVLNMTQHHNIKLRGEEKIINPDYIIPLILLHDK